MKKITTVLFDLDGTITDPFDGIKKCIQFALNEMGIDHSVIIDFSKFIGPPLHESFANILNTDDKEMIDRGLELFRIRYTDIGIYENAIYLEIEKTFKELKAQGLTLFVATSKPEVFAKRVMDHFSLTQYFTRIYGSNLDGTLTDKVELIDLIVKNEKLDPQTTIMVGDRKFDVLGARGNNIQSIGVTYGHGNYEELKTCGANFIVNTPAEIIDCILKI